MIDTSKLNQNTMRLPETQKRYMKFLEDKYAGECIFCAKDLLVKEFDLWILLKNRFPYDKIYEGRTHYLLAPKRHVEELWELTQDEHAELDRLFDEIDHNQAILNKRKDRSIPRHFHLHLVTLKK